MNTHEIPPEWRAAAWTAFDGAIGRGEDWLGALIVALQPIIAAAERARLQGTPMPTIYRADCPVCRATYALLELPEGQLPFPTYEAGKACTGTLVVTEASDAQQPPAPPASSPQRP